MLGAEQVSGMEANPPGFKDNITHNDIDYRKALLDRFR